MLKFLFLKILLIPSKFFNLIQFKLQNVKYEKTLKTYGFLTLINKGKMTIGNNCTFVSLNIFNMVGLKKKCTIKVYPNSTLKIGNNCGFSGVSIVCQNEIQICDNVTIGGNVSIWDTDFHPLDYYDRREHIQSKIYTKKILIKNDVFIGANSIILKGVTIGEKSIVGAGSVVTKSIPNNEIWAGNPARKIR